MNHIRAIAGGDLTQEIAISGRNEMGQLAAGLLRQGVTMPGRHR